MKTQIALLASSVMVLASSAKADSYAYLSASPQTCYASYNRPCSTFIDFQMPYENDTGIVTVTDLSDRYSSEKVFTCHQGRSPTEVAPWIQKNHQYEFRLYSVRDCYSPFSYGTLLDQTVVSGR